MGFRLKTRTMFPAIVTAENPITITKEGPRYTFAFSVDVLRESLDPIYAPISISTSAPIVVLVTGQSFISTFTPLSWTPASNLLVWNFSGVDGNVGTGYAAPSSTTVSLPTAYLSRLASENPTRSVYAIVVGFGGMPISHWLSGTSAPDIYQNILNQITPALAAIPGIPTKIDRFVWMQGQGDCVPLNANYIANHATMMTRFWGNSWFPRETRCDIFSIASVADGDPANVDADKMNDLLEAVTNADPDKRRYFYLSSLNGATYWDATNPGHPSSAGSIAMAQLVGRSNIPSIISDPATRQLVFGNPTFPGNGNPTITVNSNLPQSVLPGSISGTTTHYVGTNGANNFDTRDAFGGFINYIGRRANGTCATPTALALDDIISGFGAAGHTGAAYVTNRAALQLQASQAWTASNNGTYAGIYLTPLNSAVPGIYHRFDPGSFTINGLTSGGIKFAVPAVAGSNTITWPAGTTDFSATGGTSRVVKQTSAGGALTVGQLAFTDISGSVAAAQMPALTGDGTTVAGAVALTVTKINGVDQTVAWTSYTPTITSSTGTITTVGAVSGRYKQIGKTIHLQIDVVITTVGTGANFLQATLPFAAAAFNYLGSAREILLTGKAGVALITPSASIVKAIDSTGATFLGSGNQIVFGLTYEIP